MNNIYIAIILGVLSLNFFSISYKLNGVNRTLLFTPKSIFEISIPILNEEENLFLYFDKEKLEEELTYYYDTNLSKYTSEYEVDYHYVNVEDMSMCVTDFCKAVKVTVKANILYGFKYEKSMCFEIRNTSL